ncbi:MAG: arylsulfatase [Bryobacteraceae bacterium]
MPPNRRQFLKSAGALAAFGPLALAQAKRPNIVLIMVDDMGFSDLGCYGSEIATPNVDSLARGGVCFTQFYNTARCCPSRASLMTGLYSHQAGVGHMVGDDGLPGYRGELSPNCITIAEALRAAGYRTGMSGKWHVARIEGGKHNWPLQRGFERFFGTLHGGGNYFFPNMLVRGNEELPPVEPGFYYTSAIADETVKQIDEFASGDAPFFVYTAFTAPHWPLHALESHIRKYEKLYRRGWDELRRERHRRLVSLGVIDRRWSLPPRDERVPEWKDTPNKEWEARRMAVYAAQMELMDEGVGRILAKLKEKGIEDNTLVMFLSDNGASDEVIRSNFSNANYSGTTPDGRQIRHGNDPSVTPGSAVTFQSYGFEWAHLSNTPFRQFKARTHEGGIASPLIVRWPSAIRGDTMQSRPSHIIDLMPTCLEAAGVPTPAERNGFRLTPIEGRSFLPALRGSKDSDHDALYWEHQGNRAVRQGDWKLVAMHNGDWELYNLAADRTETQDQVKRHPERAEEMARSWENWAKRCQVLPWADVLAARAKRGR